jgi:hypothetical protein
MTGERTVRGTEDWRVRVSAAMLMTCALLAFSSTATAQLACNEDGVEIEFDDKRGAIELRDVRVREVTGNNKDDRDVMLANPGVQTASFNSGALTVNTLALAAFPDEGIAYNNIVRDEGKAWRARYPKGLYEFADEADLELDIEISVQGNLASHVLLGNSSWAAMSVQDAGIDVKFYGGKNKSLKQLRGDLSFQIFDLLNLTAAGVHRADLTMCINIRGTL